MTKPTDKSRQRPATAPLKAPTAPKLSLPKAPPTPAVSTAVKKPLWMPTAGPGQMPRGQTIGGVVIPRKSAPPPAKPGFFGKLWGGVKNVGRGAWDATVDSAKGIYQVVRHPVETAKALGHLATHPGQIVDVAKTMWHDATKHGVAYAVGYVGANLAPMLLTGGGSAVGVTGRVLSVAGKARTLQVLARIPTVARVAKGSQYLMRVARGRAVQGIQRLERGVAVVTKKVGKTRVARFTQGQVARIAAAKTTQVAKLAKLRPVRMAKVAGRRLERVKAVRAAKRLKAGATELKAKATKAVGDRLERVVRKADDAVMDTRAAKSLQAAQHHQVPAAANPLFRRQAQDLATKIKAIDEAAPQVAVAGARPGVVASETLQTWENAFERLAKEDPARLEAVQRIACEEAGMTAAEIAKMNEFNLNWTGQMGKAGDGAFGKVADFHLYAREAEQLYLDTASHARSVDGAGAFLKEGGHYRKHLGTASDRASDSFIKEHVRRFGEAPSPEQLGQLQEMVDLIAKVRGTREARRATVARELGLPALDAQHVRLFRGTDFGGHVRTVFDAWNAPEGAAAGQLKLNLRAGESFTRSSETAADFMLAGPRSTATQGRTAPAGGVIQWSDVPMSRVVTDKYTDLGAHATREWAQRSQQEFVVHYTKEAARFDIDQAVIHFRGSFYGRQDLDALKQAIAKHPEDWARAIGTAAPQGHSPLDHLPHRLHEAHDIGHVGHAAHLSHEAEPGQEHP